MYVYIYIYIYIYTYIYIYRNDNVTLYWARVVYFVYTLVYTTYKMYVNRKLIPTYLKRPLPVHVALGSVDLGWQHARKFFKKGFYIPSTFFRVFFRRWYAFVGQLMSKLYSWKYVCLRSSVTNTQGHIQRTSPVKLNRSNLSAGFEIAPSFELISQELKRSFFCAAECSFSFLHVRHWSLIVLYSERTTHFLFGCLPLKGEQCKLAPTKLNFV